MQESIVVPASSHAKRQPAARFRELTRGIEGPKFLFYTSTLDNNLGYVAAHGEWTADTQAFN